MPFVTQGYRNVLFCNCVRCAHRLPLTLIFNGIILLQNKNAFISIDE